MPRLISLNSRTAFVRNAKQHLRNIFTNAERFCWDQKFLLDSISDTVFSGDWHRIGGICQAEIIGYKDCLLDILTRTTLKTRYCIGGKWYTPAEVGRKGNPDYSEANTDNCHLVYVVDTQDGPQYRIFA